MGEYVRYTEEQKEAANSVQISDILDKEGEKYKKWGSQFQWLRHDSVIFAGSKWFRHSEGEGGRAIGFCMKFFGKTFPEAMEYLLDFCPWISRETSLTNLSEKNARKSLKNLSAESGKNSLTNLSEEFGKSPLTKLSEVSEKSEENSLTSLQLPKANPTMKNAYRYLIRERGIDPAVVSFFAKNGSIYEEEAWHGVVFLGKDTEGKVRNAHVRGTQDQEFGKFRMTVEGSDPHYGFGHAGTGNTLYAFEAPIDLLSFISIYPKDWQKNSYVALNGVGDNAILRYLKEHPNVSLVVLCLDNDAAGEKACKRIAGDLAEAGVTDVRRLASHGKDWNEDLMELKVTGNGIMKRSVSHGKDWNVDLVKLRTRDQDPAMAAMGRSHERGGTVWNQSLS